MCFSVLRKQIVGRRWPVPVAHAQSRLRGKNCRAARNPKTTSSQSRPIEQWCLQVIMLIMDPWCRWFGGSAVATNMLGSLTVLLTLYSYALSCRLVWDWSLKSCSGWTELRINNDVADVEQLKKWKESKSKKCEHVCCSIRPVLVALRYCKPMLRAFTRLRIRWNDRLHGFDIVRLE